MRVFLSLFLIAVSSFTLFAEEKGGEVKYKVFERPYFERNDSGFKGNSTYLHLTDKKAFEAVFGIGRVMGKAPELVNDAAFENGHVIAVIKRGEAITNYKVQSVKAMGKDLTITYSATMDPPGTATYHSPLIISIDKGKYSSVTFMENGKKAEKIELK